MKTYISGIRIQGTTSEELIVLWKELRTAPFDDVWEEYLNREKASANYIDEVLNYEKEVLSKDNLI